ncbi:MAG: type II toxin-antitoxin system HicB family antitoxin [Acidobacteria bacterium]|nr:type II toxin-antitoxin system HicB family antitoxin [Acidobacteriota bacterium]
MQRRQAKRVAPPTLIPYIYCVTVEPDDDRFYAEVPVLPGCYSWGYTYEEALTNLKDAIELWLEVKKEAGEPIPLEEPQAIRDAALTVGVFV